MPATVAAQELRRYRAFARPGVYAGAIALGALAAILLPALADKGVDPDAGIYRVEAQPDSSFMGALRSDPTFDVRLGSGDAFAAGKVELFAGRDEVTFTRESEKSRAALRHLELTHRRWLDDVLSGESDQGAAFPVRVNLAFQTRSPDAATPAPTTPRGQASPSIQTLLDKPDEIQTDLTPNQVDPPFPMQSLLLTFAYLVPMNLMGQLYSGTFFAERVRRRGILLLSAPTSGASIVLGKSIPYIGVTLVFTVGVTVAIGANWVGWLAALPIVGFVMASSLILALLAPNPRALTFLLVAVTVMVSTFLFLPAVFTNIHPVSFMSPVTVIAATIRGDPVAVGPFLYSTLPMALATITLAGLSVPLYREEALFAPRGMMAKLLDSVGWWVRNARFLLPAGVLVVPFAMAFELFVLLFAITLDIRLAFILFLVAGAFIEEALKASIAFGYRNRANGQASSVWVGLLVGGGFFLGEKLALLLALVGFGLLELGPDVLATFGVGVALPILLGPLLLHSATAAVVARGSRSGATGGLLSWFMAGAIHVAYNTVVVLSVQGGFV